VIARGHRSRVAAARLIDHVVRYLLLCLYVWRLLLLTLSLEVLAEDVGLGGCRERVVFFAAYVDADLAVRLLCLVAGGACCDPLRFDRGAGLRLFG